MNFLDPGSKRLTLFNLGYVLKPFAVQERTVEPGERVGAYVCGVVGTARGSLSKCWPEGWHAPTLAGLEEAALGCPLSKPVHTCSCDVAKTLEHQGVKT